MKAFKKIDIDEIDDMLLDNLIKHCEDSMSAPYKEKAKAAIVVKAEPEEEMLSEEDMPEGMEEEDDELDDEKREKLRKMYAMLED